MAACGIPCFCHLHNMLLCLLLLHTGWTPIAGQGVTAVQAGPSFVSQPYSGMPTSSRMEALQQQLQQPQVPQQSQQETTGFTVHYDMSTTDSDSGSDSGPLRVPLKLVVQDAVKRWFNETLSEARRGDVKQQVCKMSSFSIHTAPCAARSRSGAAVPVCSNLSRARVQRKPIHVEAHASTAKQQWATPCYPLCLCCPILPCSGHPQAAAAEQHVPCCPLYIAHLASLLTAVVASVLLIMLACRLCSPRCWLKGMAASRIWRRAVGGRRGRAAGATRCLECTASCDSLCHPPQQPVV